MIAVEGLTKRFGRKLAVVDLSFAVAPGTITGFLGPNGAGKTTTLRMLLGLVRPTAGHATIMGRRYAELEEPSRVVGAVLEAASFHPGRRARDHLRTVARGAGFAESRVDETLALVGLADAARLRVRAYSLGMRQRLNLAGALLGDPEVLVLDEPANGLDPEGIRWLRDFLRRLAAEGRTILVSSHVLAEVAQTVDRVAIIDRGRLVAEAALGELTASAAARARVRSPDLGRLRAALAAANVETVGAGDDTLVAHAPTSRVGEIAAANGVVLHELAPEQSSLEEVFLELTAEERAQA